jgi:hypothetical protein
VLERPRAMKFSKILFLEMELSSLMRISRSSGARRAWASFQEAVALYGRQQPAVVGPGSRPPD